MKVALLSLLLIFSISLVFADVKSVPGGILFTYEAPEAENVYIAGSFNDWNSSKDKLNKDEDGVWHIILKLAPGKYQYKFVVDGNWYFDQNNPQTEDDGYGGSNSVIQVDENGKLITSGKQIKVLGIKSSFNPKVYFTGRYYTVNNFQKEYRYYLEKPSHDLNFGIKVKLNPNFEAITILNINNKLENSDMWKTHLNYKRSMIKLHTDTFKITAFDNFGFIVSHDPLHIIGNIGKYGYKFGIDRRGIFIETKDFELENKYFSLPLTLKANLMYSDQAGGDENDINYGSVQMNYSKDANQNGIRIKATSAFYTFNKRANEKMRQRHESGEFDIKIEKFMKEKNWANFMKFSSHSEIYFYKNSNLYDDYKTDAYVIAPEYDWMNGSKFYTDFAVKFPKALKLKTYFITNSVNFYPEQPQTEPIYTPSPHRYKATLKRNSYNFDANFALENLISSFKLSYYKTDYPDSLVNWADYFEYMEYTPGNGRWFEKYSSFSFDRLTLLGYETALLWKFNLKHNIPISNRLKNRYEFNFTFANQDFFKSPKYSEIIFADLFSYNKNWNFYVNFRMPIYNDEVLDIKTDFKNNENVFIDGYYELSYKLKNNIKISLGYGISPEILNQDTDKFCNCGRDEFLRNAQDYEEYLQTGYKGVGQKIIDAEKKLMEADVISIKAILRF